jgi:hypothetical protein
VYAESAGGNAPIIFMMIKKARLLRCKSNDRKYILLPGMQLMGRLQLMRNLM